jgi:4-diphosphocytidyl-2-C-methyl-D-erythritol kinase
MISPLSSIKVHAPAKLNVRLKVTGRRPDGYHDLVSIMVPVTLYDIIELTAVESSGISLFCQGAAAPEDQTNLVFRAAQAFFSRCGQVKGVSIKLTKNIPVAAGLGGGSSDAAHTLIALNRMFSNPLPQDELAQMALGLGADVPFFLQGMPCIARGVGEILEPIPTWPRFWYVIVSPSISISTAWVYRNLRLELTTDEYDRIMYFLRKKTLDFGALLENDLETVTVSHFPVISSIKETLMDAGAEGALMSGSGPSVFGIFKSKDRALTAKRHLDPRNYGEVFVAETFF